MNTDQSEPSIVQLEERFARRILDGSYISDDIQSAPLAYLALQKAILLRKLNAIVSKETLLALKLALDEYNAARKAGGK